MIVVAIPFVLIAFFAIGIVASCNALLPLSTTTRFGGFQKNRSRGDRNNIGSMVSIVRSQQVLLSFTTIRVALDPGATETTLMSKSKDTDGATSTKTSKGFWDKLELMMFASLDIKPDEADGEEEDPRLVLAEWGNVWEHTEEICEGNNLVENAAPTASEKLLSEEVNANLVALLHMGAATKGAVESLTNFLEVWARITLQDDKGLTTPVSSTKFKLAPDHTTTTANACKQDSQTCTSTSMKLIFRPPKRYLSYKEQKSMEKGVLPDRKGAKVDAWSPGGVEIEVMATSLPVAVLPTNTGERTIRIGVTARRCNIDGDTVVKKTSERAIVRRLENAIRIWEKNNGTPTEKR